MLNLRLVLDALHEVIERTSIVCELTVDGNGENAEIRITPPFDGPAPVLIMLNGPAEVVVEVGIILRFELLAARERDVSIILRTLAEIFEAAVKGKIECRCWRLRGELYLIVGVMVGRSRKFRSVSIRDLSHEAVAGLEVAQLVTGFLHYPTELNLS